MITPIILLIITILSIVTSTTDIQITDAASFIEFSNNVNNGKNYTDTTVYLQNDILFTPELSQEFQPIGTDTHFFAGTFDGQGHVISGLFLNSSSRWVGIFGFSNGLTIKNVVTDKSTSIISSYSFDIYSYLGGILGYCNMVTGNCILENNVNMAKLNFMGNVPSFDVYIGGIVACIYSQTSSYYCTVKDCVNKGKVTHSGISKYVCMGGITGYSYGYSSGNEVIIENCVNYGSVVHIGVTPEVMYIGNIVNWTQSTTIINCSENGKILIGEDDDDENSSFVGMSLLSFVLMIVILL